MDTQKQTTAPRTWVDRMNPSMTQKMSNEEAVTFFDLLLQANAAGMTFKFPTNANGGN